MKKILKTTILSLLVFLSLGFFLGCCEKKPAPVGIVTPTEQPDSLQDYEVKFLFEVDGIRVYKFSDHGRQVYFTNSNGRTEYTSSHYNAGAKCSVSQYHQCINTANDCQTDEDEKYAGQKD